jgi:hypothetical protein
MRSAIMFFPGSGEFIVVDAKRYIWNDGLSPNDCGCVFFSKHGNCPGTTFERFGWHIILQDDCINDWSAPTKTSRAGEYL